MLLGEDGIEAEADGITVEDETGEEMVSVEDAIVDAAEEAVEDVELEVVDVTGCFAQSPSVN